MPDASSLRLRTATPDDLPHLDNLISQSVRTLSRDRYTDPQIESALRYVFGVDTQLVRDQTYFVVEAGGELAGCGGWSFRQTLYGGDQRKTDTDPPLDPTTDAARLRAFFVHPDFARRGVGSLLLQAGIAAARAAGFTRLELMATLPGVPLYERWGFQAADPVWVTLPDSVLVPFVPMNRTLPPQPRKICTVGDTFLLTHRGMVIVTREGRSNVLLPLCVGQEMELRRTDNTHQVVTLKSIEMVNFGSRRSIDDAPVAFQISDLASQQIEAGDELWTVPIPTREDAA